MYTHFPSFYQSIKMHQLEFIADIDSVRKEAYGVFEKSEDEVRQDVEILKKWLETQKHLPEMMSEAQIRNFLLINKFSIENAKEKIDMYYTIRSLIPEFYDNRNPKLPGMKKVFDSMEMCIYPKLVQKLYRAYMYKFKEPDKFSPVETIMTLVNTAEVRLHEDYYISDIHIIDLANFTFNDMTKMTPAVILKGMAIYEKVFSFRFKACYIINAPPYISKILAICRSVLKPKIFERIRVSENSDILKDLFSPDTLPTDYGGSGPSLQELTDLTKRKFKEYQSRFDKLDSMHVNEDLRPTPLRNDDTLGFYGNFKKLNVD